MRHIAGPRIASLLAAVIAGALAVYVLRPDAGVRSAAHVKAQAPEVRTQVIKRTVHVVRHERPPSGPKANGAGSVGSSAAASQAGAGTAARTATSGASAVAAPATGVGAPVRTSTSHTASVGTPSGGGSGTSVRTHTSGSAGGSGSGGGAVRTHTSGGGEHEGGRDD
jgi:hypothetical protein